MCKIINNFNNLVITSIYKYNIKNITKTGIDIELYYLNMIKRK